MATTRRTAKLQVLSDKVDLGGGVFLPRGNYDGIITESTLWVQGQQDARTSKVQMSFSKDFISRLYEGSRKQSKIAADADVTAAFLRGHIVES